MPNDDSSTQLQGLRSAQLEDHQLRLRVLRTLEAERAADRANLCQAIRSLQQVERRLVSRGLEIRRLEHAA